MNKDNILQYYQSFPVFNPKDVLSGKSKMALDGMKEVLQALGQPQNHCRIIHVAGTNGKGSTLAFLHQILEANGYKTGVFTSPEIDHFTEQIQINHQDISFEDLAIYTEKVDIVKKECHCQLSYFETLVCVAYLYFYSQNCDFVLMEVGLGGQDDATNVMEESLVSVLTSISYDHTELLGHTLSEIAQKKAGIIKEKGSVVSSIQRAEVETVLKETCKKKQAPFQRIEDVKRINQSISGQSFVYKNESYTISMLGNYQIQNAALALEVCECLKEKGIQLDQEKIKEALVQTKWPYRFEIVSKKPLILFDGSHNMEGIQTLRKSLESYFPNQKFTFVVGMLADKDYEKMLAEMLPLAKEFLCISIDNPRALRAESLMETIEKMNGKAKACSLEQAIKESLENEFVCIFGSLYYLGQARKQLEMKLN